jgi:NAD(P)-dependent dehydrogenase (short-subunit alcohol dehydrogenase family)
MDNTQNLKTVVVTGATSGIGLAAAVRLAQAGAAVIGIGRSEERCRAAERRLRALHPSGKADCLRADLSLLREVHAAADKISGMLAGRGIRRLDALLNNAGGFSLGRKTTAEGFDQTWALNLLSPFLLTRLMLPLLQAAPSARVVTVSSGSHYGVRMNWDDLQLRRGFYNGWRAYGQSKLAAVLFTLELNRRLGPHSSVRAFAADPGLVHTGIGAKGTPRFVAWAWSVWSAHGKTPDESAGGIVRVLLDEDVGIEHGIYWKHGRPVDPNPAALDGDSARRLWDVCEEMCALTPNPSPSA